MHLFRQSALARLVALTLVVGLATWTGAPLATAQPEVAAANVARTHAAGPIEASIAEALAASATALDPVETFEEVLREALESRNTGAALVDLLDDGGSLAEVLDLLVGALWRTGGLPLPTLVNAVPASTGSAASPNAAPAAHVVPDWFADQVPVDIILPATSPEVDVSIRILSSAQPLGP